MSWQRLCFPINGIGPSVCALVDVVESFSMKLWWRFRQNESMHAQFICSSYCTFNHPKNIKLQHHESIVWKRVCSVREVAEAFLF